MEIKIEIPDYNPDNGIKYKWENGFEIDTRTEEGVITLTANKEGLISLANHFLNLAQDKIPAGHHLHFDENNSLEEGSSELIIVKANARNRINK
jgi:hypothetical protein